jgi:hypothetical protein
MKILFVGTKVHINQYITKTFCDILFSIRALIPPFTTHCTPFSRYFRPPSNAMRSNLVPKNMPFCHAIHTTLHSNNAAFTP